MGTIAEKLSYLNTTKGKIKDSINLTGAGITDEPFRQYATKLNDAYVDIINNGTDTLYNNFPKVNSEGTSLTLNNTYQAPMRNNLKGNTSQTGTPTPSSPIPVNVVSGDNAITISNQSGTDSNTYNIDLRTSKNLFNKDTIINGKVLASNGALNDTSGFIVGDYIQVKPSTQYTISFDYTAKEYLRIGYYQKDKTFIERPFSGDRPWTITTPSNCYYIRICTPDNYTNVQCEEGNQQTTYEPYNSIELCKIGNYQDYIYKDSDKWYLHKEIRKVVLNGSEDIGRAETTNSTFRFTVGISSTNIIKTEDANTTSIILSDKFVAGSRTLTHMGTQCICYGMESTTSYKDFIIYCEETKNMTIAEFITWLSNNNVTVYYVLSTPTNIEITYQPLIEQLEALYNAKSKNNETNISQINNDLPFIISASALKKG